jgi:hypothetical protein
MSFAILYLSVLGFTPEQPRRSDWPLDSPLSASQDVPHVIALDLDERPRAVVRGWQRLARVDALTNEVAQVQHTSSGKDDGLLKHGRSRDVGALETKSHDRATYARSAAWNPETRDRVIRFFPVATLTRKR